jgi:hypothetical protein
MDMQSRRTDPFSQSCEQLDLQVDLGSHASILKMLEFRDRQIPLQI